MTSMTTLTSMTTSFNNLPLCHWWKPTYSPCHYAPLVTFSPPLTSMAKGNSPCQPLSPWPATFHSALTRPVTLLKCNIDELSHILPLGSCLSTSDMLHMKLSWLISLNWFFLCMVLPYKHSKVKAFSYPFDHKYTTLLSWSLTWSLD